MRRRSAILSWAGVVSLGLAALMALALAWPSPRDRTVASLSSDEVQSMWVDLSSPAAALAVSPVPSLTLAIDLPRAVLLGREEELGLAVDALSGGGGAEVYSLAAEVVSADAGVTPPGESGQALRAGAAFHWAVVAAHAPRVSATLLVRLRRHSPEGTAEAERLVLARDLVLPVRTVVGLSAPVARLVAAVLGLCGALLGIASSLTRAR